MATLIAHVTFDPLFEVEQQRVLGSLVKFVVDDLEGSAGIGMEIPSPRFAGVGSVEELSEIVILFHDPVVARLPVDVRLSSETPVARKIGMRHGSVEMVPHALHVVSLVVDSPLRLVTVVQDMHGEVHLSFPFID